MDTVAEAIYLDYISRVSTLPPKPYRDLPKRGQQMYLGMAVAALESIAIENQRAASGATWECPACSMDWRAAGEHNLNWIPSP